MNNRYERGCIPCGNCVVAVPQDRYYAIERFGKFEAILRPGLSVAGCDCCACCISFRSITSRVEQLHVSVHTKTSDNVFLSVQVAVQFEVNEQNIEEAIYRLANVNQQIDAYVSDVVRAQVPQMTIDETFEKKDDISHAIQNRLRTELSNFGFIVHKSLVTELNVDGEVVHAMNEINKQKRLRDAAVMSAEAQKIQTVKAAEARADSAQLEGEGIARQRKAIIEGLTESIQHGSEETLTTKKVSELLLITQYYETLRHIAHNSKAQTVFLQNGAGTVSDAAAQLRKGTMIGGPPEQVKLKPKSKSWW